ncbi:MAG: putative AlkP superfamily pyrophosphatase or phosphodiesterase [Bradymonadia bacterium]|jgi:predicted AlkP superfamily pyrophosphatase or phosphodiesterase
MMRAMRSLCLLTVRLRPLRLLLWALPMLFVACGGAPKAPPGDAGGPVVLLISMDGVRHDYPDRAPTPHFDAIKAEGASADRLIPPYPSQTFASHASMATGVVTQRHGIMNNRFRDRSRGLFSYADEATWYDRAPLWIHATRKGVRSHVFHWIGSRGPYEGVEAAVARNYDTTTTDDEKVDTIIEWLKSPTPPRLIMSYLRGCDHAGHEHGPDSPEVTDCIIETDARLGQLRARLAKLPHAVTTIIVSDHGMTNTVGEINVYDPFFESKHAVDIIASGPVAHLFTAPEARAENEARARKIPHVTVYRRDTVPAWMGYSHPHRTGDLVLVADYGWHFNARSKEKGMLPGHHGHDPKLPEMGAIFRAWGHRIKPGSMATQPKAIDLVPTICELLEIDPPEGLDGKVIDAILEPRGVASR